MDPRSALDARASLCMLLLCVIWSFQQIATKMIAAEVSPMAMMGLRSGVAVLLVGALMLWRGEWAGMGHGRWRAGAVTAALFGLEFLLVGEALRLTHAAHVVVFLYTAPVFAALGLHATLPSERLRPLQWAGIALAFAGIALAFLGRSGGSNDPQQHDVLIGDAMALLAGAGWGIATVVVRCSRLSSAPATVTLTYQLLGGFIIITPAALLTGRYHFEQTVLAYVHLAFQGLIVCFGSFLLWFWLLRRYLASRLGVFSFLTPVFGVLFGYALLGEPLEASFIAGGAIVLVGIVLVNGQELIKRALSRA